VALHNSSKLKIALDRA